MAQCLGAALLLGVPACVVHDTPPVNPGYGYGMYGSYGPQSYGPGGTASASVSVGEPSPYYVESMPPEPLYEQMTDSPGDGSVWIDGYWHWNGVEWVWVNGRWEREQPGYVYVEPNYDYVADQFVYTPGYWSTPDRVPSGWIIRGHRSGRPTMVAPPVGAGGNGGAGIRPNRPPLGNPGSGGSTVFNPPAGTPPGIRHPSRPIRDPNQGNLNFKPPPPDDGTIGASPRPPAAGQGATNAAVGGTYHPGAPTGPGYRPPGRPPVAGGVVYRPPAPVGPPASNRPIWVNPSPPATGGTMYRPPSAGPIGGPIYTRPAPIAPVIGGGYYHPAPIASPPVIHPAPIQPPAVIVRPPPTPVAPAPAPAAVAPPARAVPRR
jgi:hypothetical protein